jgi:ABC-type lipoprotein export system ATPase subunit
VIEVYQVCKSYRSGRGRVAALQDVSFTAGRGEVSVVAGKSGSGKTTLLNCIGGIERPDKGNIFCDGTDVGRLSSTSVSQFQRKHVGFVFQSGNLISYLTIKENLAFPLELNGVTGGARDRRITELLDNIGLRSMGPALPHELSGGEVQRVAFARAIAHKPAFLLVDEPTANLDTITGKQLIDVMKQLSTDQGCTLLVASHDQDVIAMGTRRLFLKDGKMEDFK